MYDDVDSVINYNICVYSRYSLISSLLRLTRFWFDIKTEHSCIGRYLVIFSFFSSSQFRLFNLRTKILTDFKAYKNNI
jgi:hypothetical protein